MDIKLKQYGDEELIRSAQMALRQWKRAESYYGNENLEKDKMCMVETLKKNYLSLLMEVRKRNLSLTPKQLLNSILLEVPSKMD